MRPIVTERVDLAVAEEGGTSPMGAHVARPAAAGSFHGVVVAMEMFGVTDYIRDVTERVARLGYVAIAPDFYHRSGPGIELPHGEEGRQAGFELVGRLTREGALRDVAAAMDHLAGRADGAAQRVAMLGCSLGGHVAYLAATSLDLAAAAVFYGGWLTTTDIPLSRPQPTVDLTAGIHGRVLYLAGEDDHAVPPDARAQIETALRSAGVRHEMVVYPDTPHGFFCDVRDTYRAPQAQDAWRRVRELLADELGEPQPPP